MHVVPPVARQPHLLDGDAARRARADAFDALTGACGYAVLLERSARRLRRHAAELTARGAPYEEVAIIGTRADRIESEVAVLRSGLQALYERLHADRRARAASTAVRAAS